MRKRKTNDETDTEWNKRPRATTTVDSGTPSIIIGSTSDTTNRKGTLKLYILHTTHPYRNLLISIIPADTQRRAREMRRAILLSKKPIRKIPTAHASLKLHRRDLRLDLSVPTRTVGSGAGIEFSGSECADRRVLIRFGSEVFLVVVHDGVLRFLGA
ncbi:hypothetical protein YC2023_097854 [Brassica napus]